MLADRAIVKSLGWVQRRLLGTEFPSGSSGSSDLGMHFVAPTIILHCSREEKKGGKDSEANGSKQKVEIVSRYKGKR